MDWHLDKSVTAKTKVTTGPILPPNDGDLVSWYMHNRQGVHFLKETDSHSFKFSVKYLEGGINFKFDQDCNSLL